LAALIPAIGTCVSRMTGGERRLAYRLELKLVAQMVNPGTNSLLVLYDDAQSIYGREKRGKLSFKSLGIQAQGRTTILKINYRNTQEVLELASGIASELLKPSASDEDGVPLVAPISAGRHGPKPLLIKLPSIQEEADYIAKHLKEAHKTGTPWSDMAVIYRDYGIGKPVLATLRKAGIPVTTYQDDITFEEKEDTVKFLTMHSCKGLEFPLVAIPGVGRAEVDEKRKDEEARLLYVAMTRATRELVVVGVKFVCRLLYLKLNYGDIKWQNLGFITQVEF
jgi:superfamily I DNA/RNA helicase